MWLSLRAREASSAVVVACTLALAACGGERQAFPTSPTPASAAGPTSTEAPFSLEVWPPGAMGGETLTATLRLTQPAPASGLNVQLTADPRVLQLPSSVTVPPGADVVRVEIVTLPVSLDTHVVLRASSADRAITGAVDVWALLPNFVSLTGDPGDGVLNGTVKRFTPDNARITASCGLNNIFINANSAADISDYWQIHFRTPRGTPLQVGSYAAVSAAALANAHEVNISGRGLGCFGPGRLVVNEVSLRRDGSVERLWVVFERQCDGSSTTVRGHIRLMDPARGSQAHESCVRRAIRSGEDG